MAKPVVINASHIVKTFENRKQIVYALDNISFSVHQGEFFCIVGPSGCGKTTLLRILAGLEKTSEGSLSITSIDPKRPQNSMVFQEQSIFPWMSVRNNVAYGLRLRGIPRDERYQIADYYIQMIGLTNFADCFPHQLSGGMKQRVSVARAFANDPDILLMDEPFGALDEQNRIILQQELLSLWERTKKTAVFITHSIDEALCLGDRIMIMTAHPGRIKNILTVDLPRPRDISTIRTTLHYNQLFQTVWDDLREEVLKARSGE